MQLRHGEGMGRERDYTHMGVGNGGGGKMLLSASMDICTWFRSWYSLHIVR